MYDESNRTDLTMTNMRDERTLTGVAHQWCVNVLRFPRTINY